MRLILHIFIAVILLSVNLAVFAIPASAQQQYAFNSINYDGYIKGTESSYGALRAATSGVVSDQGSYSYVGQRKTSHEAVFYGDNSDGHLYYTDAVYLTAHDATAAETLQADTITATIGQDTNYGVYRAFFYFDTSDLPDDAVIDYGNTILSLYVTNDQSATDFTFYISSGMSTYPHDPLVVGDFSAVSPDNYGTDFNTTKSTATITASQYNDLAFDSSIGVTVDGWTKFMVWSSLDYAATTPTGNEYVQVATAENTANAPKLTVTYTTYEAYRSALYFDTSLLPDNATIDTATLSLYGHTDAEGVTGNKLYVTSGAVLGAGAETEPTPLAVTDFDDLLGTYDEGSRGELTLSSWVTTDYNNITLNDAGEQDISRTGYTVFGLITKQDVDGTAPTTNEYIGYWSQERGYLYEPILTITYTIPALGEPSNFGVSDIQVFTDYVEEGDQLYVFRSQVEYSFGTPSENPREEFALQLLLEDSSVAASLPLQHWGYRPSSIYLNGSWAPDWGGQYTVRIVSVADASVYAEANVETANWRGDTVGLDSWVESAAKDFGWNDYYDLSYYGTEVLDVWKLTDAGSIIFTLGVSYIQYVRPTLFQYAVISPTPAGDDLDNTTLFSRWGSTFTGLFDDVATPLGTTGRTFSGILLIVVMVAVVALSWWKTNRIEGGIVLCIPILLFGTVMGSIPLVIGGILGSLILLFAAYKMWLAGGV